MKKRNLRLSPRMIRSQSYPSNLFLLPSTSPLRKRQVLENGIDRRLDEECAEFTSCSRRRRRRSRSWRLRRRIRRRSWRTRRVRRRSERWGGREASGGTRRGSSSMRRARRGRRSTGRWRIWGKIRTPATGMPISMTFPPLLLCSFAFLKLWRDWRDWRVCGGYKTKDGVVVIRCGRV